MKRACLIESHCPGIFYNVIIRFVFHCIGKTMLDCIVFCLACQLAFCLPSKYVCHKIDVDCLINVVHEMCYKRSVLKLLGLNCVITSLSHMLWQFVKIFRLSSLYVGRVE
jgi:hypothetical protein